MTNMENMLSSSDVLGDKLSKEIDSHINEEIEKIKKETSSSKNWKLNHAYHDQIKVRIAGEVN